jgi:CDI immunity proteins
MQSLEQIEGVWPEPEPEFESGLVLRCHAARKKPIDRLSDLELATLLNQDIGVAHILPEAVRRLTCNQPDDSEYFDGQLKEAVEKKTQQDASANAG